MIQVTQYTQDGVKNGTIQLPESLFSLPWSDALVHQVIVGIEANRRAGTAHTKGRSDVRGGGRKPWRQKGTGRARHGSIRSPLWVGGGVTFGPDKRKKYGVLINKKMRVRAFFTVLSDKVRNNAVSFLEPFTLDMPSTKKAIACLTAIYGEKQKGCTIVFSDNNFAVRKSFSNIPGIRTVALEACNTWDVLNAKNILFMGSEKTLAHLKERAAKLTVAEKDSLTNKRV